MFLIDRCVACCLLIAIIVLSKNAVQAYYYSEKTVKDSLAIVPYILVIGVCSFFLDVILQFIASEGVKKRKDKWAARTLTDEEREQGKENECSICIDNGCDCRTACGHWFHVACISQWDKPSCPVCRQHMHRPPPPPSVKRKRPPEPRPWIELIPPQPQGRPRARSRSREMVYQRRIANLMPVYERGIEAGEIIFRAPIGRIQQPIRRRQPDQHDEWWLNL